MKIVLNQIAKVSRAEIELNGITVLAGSNGTGKSTICKSLYAVSQLGMQGSRLIACEKIRSIIDLLRPELEKLGVDVWMSSFGRIAGIVTEETELTELLKREFWTDSTRFAEWAANSRYFGFDTESEDVFNSDLYRTGFAELSRLALSVLDKEEHYYADYVSRNLVNAAFSKHTTPVSGATDGMSITLALNAETDGIFVPCSEDTPSHALGVGKAMSTSCFYLEPQHCFDQLWNRPMWNRPMWNRSRSMSVDDPYRFLARQSFQFLWDDVPPPSSAEDDESYKKVLEALEELVAVIHGRIKREGGTVGFVETSGKRAYFISPANVASGAKTMSLLIDALEKRTLRPGGMLIIDEPESNLHPEWQIRFAHFLVAIASQFDIKILLSTHSPYFMRAIQKYAQEAGISNRNKFYTMRADVAQADGKGADDDGMVPPVGAFSYHSVDVSENVESLFAELCEPLESVL